MVIKKSAIKDFKKISKPFKTQIKKAVKSLENYPDISNIKRLTNFQPLYRMRVGSYRILFDIIAVLVDFTYLGKSKSI